MIAACVAVGVSAQETVPDTPPELKDFRLDTPKPKESQPQAAQPPLPTPAPQPQPKVNERVPVRPPTHTVPPPASKVEPESRTEAEPPPEADATEAAPEAASTIEPVTVPVADTSPAISGLLQFWPLLLALLAVLAGWFVWRNWKARQLPPRAPIVFAGEPDPEPATPVAAPPPAQIRPRGALTATFEPADARLSIANLTVTGCLRLRYEGPEPLQSLRLRNMVISACEGQRAMIDAFHGDETAGQVDILDGIQPGEEIVLTLELQVPRDALQAFDWRERRFVAPILLLNVGAEDGEVAPCRITTLVGQAGDPGSPKMHPLPVDRGPKLFEDLRFQPIAA